MNDLASLALGLPFGLTALRLYAVGRLMKTLRELLESAAADLDPTIDYTAQLRSGGFRTVTAVKQADNAEQIQRACGLLLGDANIIWKAARGIASKQLNLYGL